MSKPKAPAPPDPTKVANAQTQSNLQTAGANQVLGNTNQNTPYGSVSYSYAPGPGGVNQATQTVTESANQRALRERQEGLGIALGDLGQDQVSRVGDILGKPYEPRRFDMSAATGGKLDLAGALGSYDGAKYDPTTSGLDLSGFDPSSGGAPNYSAYDPTKQPGLDLSGQRMDAGQYDPSTLGSFGDDVRARSFALATQGLDDQFNRSEESLRTRLANQGVNAGTDAFGAELESFNRGKGNAYADALLAADDNAIRQRGAAAGELAQGYSQDAGARGMNADLISRERADQMSALSRGGDLAITARDQRASELGQGAGYATAENADRLARQGLGFEQNLANRGQMLSELLTERGANLGEAQTQYGYDNTADLAQRQNPLNEIIALMGGIGTTPINPGQPAGPTMAGTDVAGIQQQGFANNMGIYGQQMNARNALLGSLAGLGGAALGAPGLFGSR